MIGIAGEVRPNVHVHELVEVDTQRPIRADDLVGPHTLFGGHIPRRIVNLGLGGIFAGLLVRAFNGGGRQPMSERVRESAAAEAAERRCRCDNERDARSVSPKGIGCKPHSCRLSDDMLPSCPSFSAGGAGGASEIADADPAAGVSPAAVTVLAPAPFTTGGVVD